MSVRIEIAGPKEISGLRERQTAAVRMKRCRAELATLLSRLCLRAVRVDGIDIASLDRKPASLCVRVTCNEIGNAILIEIS
jgi:hypothetical protein